MLRVINFGAACCVIESGDTRILCDPWFTDGCYLGCWEREDWIPDPVHTIGPCDYIWISHLHEDHYDPPFLRAYLKEYPAAELAIHPGSAYLEKIMKRDGFNPVTYNIISMKNGAVALYIVPNHGYPNEIDNIDTALVAIDADSAVVNMNDCPYDQEQINAINLATAGKHVTALLPYTGAGPWPQCFDMAPTDVIAAADNKRAKFLAQFERYRVALHADVAVPFSAGYRLRGTLAQLNPYRGIPRQQDVPHATVLPVTGARGRAVYCWEDGTAPSNDELDKLLQQAAARSPKAPGEPLTIDINWGTGAAYVDATAAPATSAHETITLDPRLLHGLLTRKYHWNTAEISSALKISRKGRPYDARVFDFLYRFHV